MAAKVDRICVHSVDVSAQPEQRPRRVDGVRPRLAPKVASTSVLTRQPNGSSRATRAFRQCSMPAAVAWASLVTVRMLTRAERCARYAENDSSEMATGRGRLRMARSTSRSRVFIFCVSLSAVLLRVLKKETGLPADWSLWTAAVRVGSRVAARQTVVAGPDSRSTYQAARWLCRAPCIRSFASSFVTPASFTASTTSSSSRRD